MIRDAVLHLLNEQPLVADLPAEPQPGDVVLICTNLRTKNRNRPEFVDDMYSTFVIPYTHVRFVEIPRERRDSDVDRPVSGSIALGAGGTPDGDLEVDEDFLRRVREV